MLSDLVKVRTKYIRKGSLLQLELQGLTNGVSFGDVMEYLEETFSCPLKELTMEIKKDCTVEFSGPPKPRS